MNTDQPKDKKPKTFEKYGANWKSGTSDIKIEMACIQAGGEWTNSKGSKCGLGLFYHYKELQKILWPEDDHHRWTDLILGNIVENDVTVIMGPGDCVHGDTLIVDAFSGESRTIKDLADNCIAPRVLTKLGIKQAGIPFKKGNDTLFLVKLESGNSFRATAGHKVRCYGQFKSVSELEVGNFVEGYTNLGTTLGIWDFQDKITLITPIGKHDFYDLQVPDAHHYYAEGVIHHNSGKTYSAVRYALCDFWCFPDETLILISSTDQRSLELRIWGWIKTLFNRGKERFPWLRGCVLEAQHAIAADRIEVGNDKGRSLNKGLICVPCVGSNGATTGLQKLIGTKPPINPKTRKPGRLRHIGDECQFMAGTFLDAYANWYGKPGFKGIMSGNPIDPLDCLGRAAEPIEGWDAHPEPTKTAVWKSRFYNASVVNLVGPDSPNFDFPDDTEPRFSYLTSKKKLDAVAKMYGKDSPHYYTQCVGVMKSGIMSNRVLTRDLCRRHKAHDSVIWDGGKPSVKLYALDPAYGGGDRCSGVPIEFGKDVHGNEVLWCGHIEIIPVSVKKDEEPEMQIANFVSNRLLELATPPPNCFYDSFGKGTIGNAFARVFGASSPTPVDSGMQPTDRPVRFDLYITEKDGTKRLKKCSEHYSKFVTEMWFSVREMVEGNQMRNLSMEAMEEGCMREYYMVSGNRIEIEPKPDMKQRIGRSPDFMDVVAVGCEGARRLGFKIMRLGGEIKPKINNWFPKLAEKWATIQKEQELSS